jgi:hypothetical protein
MTHEEALKPLDSAIWEMSEAFDGLQDEDVWVRAHPRLLSVGELAAHVAYGEVVSILGTLESPLITPSIRYYPVTMEEPVVAHLGASDLYAEVKRIHEACRAFVLETRPDLESLSPHREEWTWSYVLEYMAFHMAYHTGQMYSVRHLMGHETNNN